MNEDDAVEVPGSGVIVYRDWKMLILLPLAMIALPITAFIDVFEESAIYNTSVNLTWPFVSIFITFIMGVYHKYLRRGITLDLNERAIYFPKVSLIPFVRSGRRKISFKDITGIQAVDEAGVEKNQFGVLNLVRTYKFQIHGTFGSKTVRFRSMEKRDTFYSLMATYGNFS